MNRKARRQLEKLWRSKRTWRRTQRPAQAIPVGNGNAYFANKVKATIEKYKRSTDGTESGIT